MRALYDSRSPIDEVGRNILQELRSAVGTKSPFKEIVSGTDLRSLDHKGLTTLARELHDRVSQGSSGYEDALTDMVTILDQLAPNTAASIYLGFLASMYLHRDFNLPRIPPRSPVAQLLFERQARGYALHAVHAVSKRLVDNDRAPLYVPDVGLPPVRVSIETVASGRVVDRLRSVKVGRVELLTPAQSDPLLRLSSLFGADLRADNASLVRKACEYFGMPVKQVECKDRPDRTYALTSTLGFKRPADVSVPKEGDSDE